MATIRVGWRRLYDALACGTISGDSFSNTARIDDRRWGSVYLGARPRLGITVAESELPYIIPARRKQKPLRIEYHHDPQQSRTSATFFTELICWIEHPVDDAKFEAFWSGDHGVSQEILGTTTSIRGELEDGLDLLAGIVGLKIHRQFVLEPICDHAVALRQPNSDAFQLYSPAWEVLQPAFLTESGRDFAGALLNDLQAAGAQAKSSASRALGWLVHAWRERDAAFQFLSLFIPLEICLSNIEVAKRDTHPAFEILRSVLHNLPKEDRETAEKFLAYSEQSRVASLFERFRDVAEFYQQPTWTKDVEAFRRFNKMRNDLIHKGNRGVSLIAFPSEEIRVAMRDLVERYVSLTFFGEGSVYPDRWR